MGNFLSVTVTLSLYFGNGTPVAYHAVNLGRRASGGAIDKAAVAALVGSTIGVPLEALLDASRLLDGTGDGLEGLVEPDDLDGAVGHGGIEGDHVGARAVVDVESGSGGNIAGRGAVGDARDGSGHQQDLGSQHIEKCFAKWSRLRWECC